MSNQNDEINPNENDPPSNIINQQDKEKIISLDINAPTFESKMLRLKSSAKPFYPKNHSQTQHSTIIDTPINNNILHSQRPAVMSGYRAVERVPYASTFMNGKLMYQQQQHQQLQQIQPQTQNLNLYQIQNRMQTNINQAYVYQQYGIHLPLNNIQLLNRNAMIFQNNMYNSNIDVNINKNDNNNSSHVKLNPKAVEFKPKSKRINVVNENNGDNVNKSNFVLNPNATPYQYKGNKNNLKADNKNEEDIHALIQEESKDNLNTDQYEPISEATKEEVIMNNIIHNNTNYIKEKEDDDRKEEIKNEHIQQIEEQQQIDVQENNEETTVKENMSIEPPAFSSKTENQRNKSKLQMLFDNKTEIKVEATVSGITQKTKVKQKEGEILQRKYTELKRQEIERKKKEEHTRKEEEQKKKEEEKKRQEEQRLQKEQQQLKEKEESKTITRNYFIISSNSIQPQTSSLILTPDYIYSYCSWQICLNTDLLSTTLLSRFEQMQTYDEIKNKNISKHTTEQQQPTPSTSSIPPSTLPTNSFSRGKNLTTSSSISTVSMQPWGRKEITQEIKQAEEFKKRLEETRQKDPIKYELTEYLNILTVDNYNETKEKILTTIQSNVEYQDKFIEVLFQKAIHEKSFVFLYANLCKELNQVLQQTADKNDKTMRTKLIEKCRDIFKIENNIQLEEYVNVKDPTERESKIKKFVLGNVNFIGELININVMKKEIVFQCTKDLFKRYEKENTDKILKLINLEAIVIFLDKFGTLLQKQRIKLKAGEYEDYTMKLNTVLDKLDTIQQRDTMPGFIKYKIINLLEKKKNGWEETEYEKNIKAKGKDDVRKAYEQQSIKGNTTNNSNNNSSSSRSKLDQDSVNDKIRNDLIEWKDFIENGGNVRDYQWEIITELYQYYHNTLGEILIGFFENCFDFVDNKTSIHYANSYWSELIQYYAQYLNTSEINELVNSAFNLLSNITTLSLDNMYLYDIMSNIILCMVKHKVCRYSEIERFNDLYEDDLKGVFKVIQIIGQTDEKVFIYVEKTNIVKDNRELYDEIIQG